MIEEVLADDDVVEVVDDRETRLYDATPATTMITTITTAIAMRLIACLLRLKFRRLIGQAAQVGLFIL